MTTQEIIEGLTNILNYCRYHENAPALREAIEMLKCSEIPNSSDERTDKRTETHSCDIISRQAAIDAICKACSMEGDYHKCDGYPETSTWCDELVALRALQSAQPETEERTAESAQNVPNDELISKKAAIDALAKMMPSLMSADGSHPADEEIFKAQEIFADCIKAIEILPSAQPYSEADIQKIQDLEQAQIEKAYELGKLEAEHRWIPCSELPSDNREVEVTCEVRRCDGKRYRYTCHASYVHRYSIESTGYCDWEDCDEYNEEEDKYYALPGWYERVHNWDDYSFIVIADFVTAWREPPEPYREGGNQDE